MTCKERSLRALRLALLLTSAAAATVAVAHHSAAMYDDRKEMSVEGTVAEFRFANPHTFLIVAVPGKNGVQRHTFEAPAPSYLKRYGWKFNSLQPGEKVKVVANPLRAGRPGGPGGQLLDVIFADGRKLDAHQRLGHYEFNKEGGLVIQRFKDDGQKDAKPEPAKQGK